MSHAARAPRGLMVKQHAPLTFSQAIETIQRELDIDERGTRPSTGPVGHSGYLVFARNS